MNAEQFQKYLRKQSSRLKTLGKCELDLADYEEASAIVDQARQKAIDNHLPTVKVRHGPMSVDLARSILGEMIRVLPARDTYTPVEVASRLGTKASTVRGWIASGKLKASNIGQRRSRYVIREVDLNDFLDYKDAIMNLLESE